MTVTDDHTSDIAKPIYWPVWTPTETRTYPLGHEAALTGARELLQKYFRQEAGLDGKQLIGVERTAQGRFPIFG
jgi:hypothetical protein